MDGNDLVQNYCRICASNSPDARNIFEVVYKEMRLSDILGQCLQCTIYRTEYLPELICSECCADLIKMHKFIANYEKSEKWFMSRYNAINEGKLIKNVCPMEFERIPEIPVESQRQILAVSLASAVSDQDPLLNPLELMKCEVAEFPTSVVPVQDPSPNPLELKEELDYDYEFEMAEFPANPNGSNFEMQQPNEANDQAIKVTQKKVIIRPQKGTAQYQCSMCSKQFKNSDNLKYHENLHTGAKVFQCFFCDAKLLRSDYRVKHMRKMHPEVVFECFICKIALSTFYGLLQHMAEGNHAGLPENETNFTAKVSRETKKIGYNKETGKYQCSLCSRQFKNSWKLRYHENLHTGAKVFQCFFCDAKLLRSDYRVKHMRKMHPEVALECSECKITLSTYNRLLRHMADCNHAGLPENETNFTAKVPRKTKSIHHNKETAQNQCSMCSKQFTTSWGLKYHENLHTSKKTYKCYYCDEPPFLRSDYRLKHIRRMHPDIVFECFVCKFEFDSYKGLNQHIKDGHTNTLPAKRYMCEACGKSFTEKYRLTEHQICLDGKKRFMCTHQGCQRAYSGKQELRDHLKIHDGKKEYFCECGEGFILSRQLRHHRANHHGPPIVHHCSLCSKVYKTKKALRFHMDRHNGKMYQCNYCDLQFTSHPGRQIHQRNMHVAPKSYECFDCKRVFKYRLDLLRHMETHASNGRVTFECEICLKPFLAENAFIIHKRKHKAQIFDCEYCNESFEKKLELNSHVREMHADNLEQYNCDQCSKFFPLKSKLKSHIYQMHYIEKQERLEGYLCTECGRTFRTNKLLKIHSLAHSDERPASCSQCPGKFKNRSQLRIHMRVHSAERNFICKVVLDGERICGKTFQAKKNLKDHAKTHGDYKLFQCQSCPTKFSSKYKLEVHARTHTGERPFKCEHCNRAFTQKGDMTKHLLIHLGPTPHKCNECGESFRLETQLRHHSYSHFKPPEN